MGASVSFNSVTTSGSTVYVSVKYGWTSPTYNQTGSASITLYVNGAAVDTRNVYLASGGGTGYVDFTTTYTPSSGATLMVYFWATKNSDGTGTNAAASYTLNASSGGSSSGGGDSGGGSSSGGNTGNPTYPEVGAYRLWINQGEHTNISVRRTGSSDAWAQCNIELYNGDWIYYHDVIIVTYGVDTGYDLTLDAPSMGSNGDIWVLGDVTITSSASVKEYTLSLEQSYGAIISVNRISSPLKGASIGNISNVDAIYYNDVLNISYNVVGDGNEVTTATINGVNFYSGYLYIVNSDAQVVVSGLNNITNNNINAVYINNGSGYDRYLSYINNETNWELYTPWIYNGMEWSEIQLPYKIIVNTKSGSTVTATCGGVTKTGVYRDGSYIISGCYPGTWIITVTQLEYNTGTVRVEISKNEEKFVYFVSVTITKIQPLYLIQNGIQKWTNTTRSSNDGYHVDFVELSDNTLHLSLYPNHWFKFVNIPCDGYSMVHMETKNIMINYNLTCNLIANGSIIYNFIATEDSGNYMSNVSKVIDFNGTDNTTIEFNCVSSDGAENGMFYRITNLYLV